MYWPPNCETKGLSAGRYHIRMQSIEINPELSRLALEEAARQYPEFAGRALRVIARPLSRGFAWQLEWNGTAPSEQAAWEFQNAAIRATFTVFARDLQERAKPVQPTPARA